MGGFLAELEDGVGLDVEDEDGMVGGGSDIVAIAAASAKGSSSWASSARATIGGTTGWVSSWAGSCAAGAKGIRA